jgi:hypothetical protein
MALAGAIAHAGERYLLVIRPVRTLGGVRVRCGLLALVVVITACGSSTAASSTSGSGGGSGTTAATTSTSTASAASCGPAAATTLASNRSARIYNSGGWVYGCVRATGHRVKLGNARFCVRSQRAAPVALAGTLAAYGLETCGVDTGSSVVIVRQLTDGRTLRTLPATTGPQPPESYQQVGSIVVKRDGAVAWIGTSNSIIRHNEAVEVHRADSRGKAELDSGAAIQFGSLRLHASTLSWRHGSATKSSTLL